MMLCRVASHLLNSKVHTHSSHTHTPPQMHELLPISFTYDPTSGFRVCQSVFITSKDATPCADVKGNTLPSGGHVENSEIKIRSSSAPRCNNNHSCSWTVNILFMCS